ncbi:unnamed protein product [Pseudo-nitzschia multistriata]|uniref:Uncharacterized protein n=1 Tax=Pseudo-nitzschia multistriata TaxID=183589 RepID=A0A448ZNK9_9STRA|nr:unnamed protein product [Pseudo-nitzschia multistriata]
MRTFQFLIFLVLSGIVVSSEQKIAAESTKEKVKYRKDASGDNDSNDVELEVNPERKGGGFYRDDLEKGVMDDIKLDNSKIKKNRVNQRNKNLRKETEKVNFVYGLDGELEPVLSKDDLERHITENLLEEKEANALRRAGPLPKGIFDERRSGTDGHGGVVLTEEELEDIIKENNIDDQEAEVFRALRPYSYYNYRAPSYSYRSSSYYRGYYNSKGGKGKGYGKGYGKGSKSYYGKGYGKGSKSYYGKGYGKGSKSYYQPTTYSYTSYNNGYSYGHRKRSYQYYYFY